MAYISSGANHGYNSLGGGPEYPTNAATVRAFVAAYDDDSEIDDDDMIEAFRAAYGRNPDQEDYDTGLWSLICAADAAEEKRR